MDPQISSQNAPQKCQTCHIKSVSSIFKNCVACREKNRVKSQLKAKRRRDRELAAMRAKLKNSDTDIDSYDSSTTAGPELKLKPEVKASKKNPKELILLRDLEAHERKKALKEMKLSLRRTIAAQLDHPSSSIGKPFVDPKHPTETVKEYQTASALYDKLKARSSRSILSQTRLNFSGCHSIVAVPSIDNVKRVDLVTEDLHKIVRIRFGSTEIGTGGGLKAKSHYSKTFACDCLGTSDSNSKSSMNMSKKSEGQRRDCGGEVNLTSLDHLVHPGGVLGQRIVVRVSHPSSS